MVFKSKPVKEVKKIDSQAMAMTFISQGSEIVGNIHTAGNLRVDGTIRGKVRADGDLEVSPGGLIEGENVSARNIVIHGTVKATLNAVGHLRIHSQGEVQGDVTAEALDIESGARFVGYSHTGKASADILTIEHPATKETSQ